MDRFIKIKARVPIELELQDAEPLYWVELTGKKRTRNTEFFDLSKNAVDPDFRFLIIITDQLPGFDEHFLVCYFDDRGNWITQSPFDTLEDAFRHGEYAFGISKEMWARADESMGSE